MKRLNIYFIHSTKFDYQNLLYKKILSSRVCLTHNLMLPQTTEYHDKYTKDLMNKADIIITILSYPSFGLDLELKFLNKIDKPKLFLSLENKVPKKYRKYPGVVSATDDNIFLKTIEDFINENAIDAIDINKDNTITLGDL